MLVAFTDRLSAVEETPTLILADGQLHTGRLEGPPCIADAQAVDLQVVGKRARYLDLVS
jgi:hypothetical protein